MAGPSNGARASLLFTSTTLLFGVGACEQLIGIEDTPVVERGSTATAGSVHSNHAGTSSAGAAGTPEASEAGFANAGKDETAGSSNGG